jgi:hypothetical protein
MVSRGFADSKGSKVPGTVKRIKGSRNRKPVNDDFSLTSKGKSGDYDAGNGSKTSVELGWHSGSNSNSSRFLGLGGTFSTNAAGGLDTNLTQDEFNLHADSGSNGNDWFRTEYDWNAKAAYDLTDASRTWHHEYDSKVHEASSLRSNGNSTFNFDLSKSTGGDASGSIALDFNGGSGDEWHVDNNSNDEWEERDDYGASGGTVTKNKLKSKYKVDDVYSSTYRGNPSVSLGSDGSATLSGSSSSDEEYTFDQVSEEEEKSSAETTDSWNNDSAEGPAETSTTQTNWHLLESERYEKTTDHYEAEMSSDASLGSGSPPTLTGSDEGYTDTETFNKSCHTWDTYGTASGPDCNETTTTDHEDWPSMVDELLAMMEMEAEAGEMGENADDGEGVGADANNWGGNEQGGGNEAAPGSGVFLSSLSDSWGGMQDTYTSLILSHWYGLSDEGQQVLDRAYLRSPLGQTRDSSGVYYYGTRGALAVSATATAAAAAVGATEVTLLGNESVAELNILSQGNVFKILSRPFKGGFRIDPAHHGKPWGHGHWWRW